MSTTTTTLVTSGTPWHPQSFADLSKRLQSEPEAVSHDVDFTFQALAMRSQTQQTSITQINNIISGKGTVSSVALAMPSVFDVTGSPITASGTLNVDFISQAGNLFLASPDGAPGLPTFRAIVAGDIPFVTPSSRTISTALPLTGGGALTSDLALAVNNATATTVGVVRPDDDTITITSGIISASRQISLLVDDTPNGDQSALNLKQGQAVALSDDRAGTVTVATTIATTGAVGVVKPDGTTITIDGTGTITSVSGGVPTTRQINTTVPLTGGGDLSADRTLSISDFVGDTGTGGVKGAVPAPAAGDAAAGKFLKADGTWTAPAGSGTVTSVGLSLPADFTVTGSPVTTTGTLTGAWANESANVVHAGPASGAAAAPTWRALVSADIPLATSSATGAVKPDNTTITISSGVISAVAGATPAMVLITETILSGTATNFSFSSIPATYRDLIVRFMGRGDAVANFIGVQVTLNSDTGNNYIYSFVQGSGTTAQGGTASAQSALFGNSANLALPGANATANYAGSCEFRILDYRETTFFKGGIANAGFIMNTTAANMFSKQIFGMWLNTAAITSITLTASTGNFIAGSRCSLYGSL